MSHDDDHAVEPIRGLPELPPKGEFILWQGAPHWTTLALRAFHLRKVIVFLGLFLFLRGLTGFIETQTVFGALLSMGFVFMLSLTAIGLFMALAYATARATVYTITNQRVVIRFGVALQMTINLPFALIESASLKTYRDGTGDVPMKVDPEQRISYVVLWPHVRPWRWLNPQPMLRGIPNAQAVAEVLANAMAENAVQRGQSSQDPDQGTAATVGA
ncbi:PH domain-containing protein [Ectothiorhodosinus mongolicus]|uniref:PH domain-containing protein n=1 Tax=Ectothiorhodosinus mongolicus TaxID=233100 RepID=A0A1R3VM03_9GAMM|nr:photosynthetic complex putative assembly protein PuhB [Ectothiorhodosinus mongolicus]ULX57712.1 phosphopantetheine adenylyltransferase [Ectothiorhodosinus mongolicus]SIT65566.1 PH domain-containing protein [Ectothiorhodosinus mongolicus]